MARPDFTRDEEYLIAYYRSPLSRRYVGSAALRQVTVALLLYGMGLYLNQPVLTLIGFSIVVYFRVLEGLEEGTWDAAFRGLIGKYEAALRVAEETPVSTASSTAIKTRLDG